MNTKNHNQVEALIAELGVSEASFLAFTGLASRSLNADEKEIERNRIDTIFSIFTKLKAWFDSPEQAWEWYTKQKIIGFGNLTPAEIVMKNPDSGASAVISYIKSKELGGFE